MKKLILILGLAMLLPARASWAQVAAPNSAGVSMGHVHFLVQDVDAAKTFWTAMGGVPGKLGPNDVYKFPGVLILVRKGDATAPSVGSVVGHIGFHVPDTTAALARWKAAGLNTEVGQNPGQGFVWTPDKLTTGRDSGGQDTNRSHRVSPRAFLYRGNRGLFERAGDAVLVRQDVRRQAGETRPI